MTSNTPGGATGTPGGQGQGGGAKRARAQNLVPMSIGQMMACAGEEGIKLEGKDVGMVLILGQVKSVDIQATKSVYNVEDEQGDGIDAVHWTDESQEKSSGSISENMYVKVIGTLRSSGEKKHLMVYKIWQVESKEERDSHLLEIAYAKAKIKQLVDQENMSIGANVSGSAGLSNSMMGGQSAAGSGSNFSGGPTGGVGGSSFGNPKYDAVHKVVSACEREEGIHRDTIAEQLKGRYNPKDINDALEFLSSEGHIYSTIDDDNFKSVE